MAQINKPTDYFETTTYAGGTTSITSLDFSPDWVWAKKRTGVENHGIFDSVRGATKTINSNTTSAETTRGGSLTSFDSNGWSMGGADGIISAPGSDYVAWAWRGSDSSAVSNTDGSITSTVSANTTSGFSIVSFTGTGANATVGHGLGSAPKMVIFKNRDNATQEWDTYHTGLTDATYFIQLNSTNAQSNTNGALRFNSTAPTSSVFSVGTATTTNESGNAMIAYCFAEKKGYSKFGSYTGNGSADGTFVYTGFKPSLVITKRTSTSGTGWVMMDNKRETTNDGATNYLLANDSVAETSASFAVDFLSNGFKPRTNSGGTNTSDATYIYMAFAENPLVTTGKVPATAR